MYTFLIYAALAGLIICFATAPLGSFVVWRRMAYFGDTLSHAALLGVALGVLLQLAHPLIAVVFVCLTIAGFLLILEHRPQLASDSILGILAHTSLALGVILVALMPNFRGDLFGYLFGDILAVGPNDLWLLGFTILAVVLLMARYWQGFLAMTIHEELAEVEGVPVHALKALFVVLLAVVIAVSMKLLGVLLITAMLIIPAVTARPFSNTPERMVLLAGLSGMISVLGGLAASWAFDTPAAPSIVVVAALQFLISQSCALINIQK